MVNVYKYSSPMEHMGTLDGGNIFEITKNKVGPLPIINGVITPISRVITPVTHL